MALRRYAELVYGWSRYQPDRGYEFSGTALVAGGSDAGHVLLVDPVPATTAEKDELHALGKHFHVVLLNADHERDAATFARDFDAPVSVARADLASVRFAGALAFDDGHVFPGGWRAHVLADLKTPGESVLFHEAQRLVVAGDAVIGDPVTGLRLVPPAKLKDRAAALASLRRLAGLDFDGLLLADGFVLPTGGRAALQNFLARESAR